MEQYQNEINSLSRIAVDSFKIESFRCFEFWSQIISEII